MAEWIGQFLGQFPLWVAMPIAVVGLLLWVTALMPFGEVPFERWLDRRRREKEINRGKK